MSVTTVMNEALTKEFTVVEIKTDVFAIHPEKAPGPYGMTALFYQKFWHILGPQVVAMVKDFITSGRFDPCLNEVNIFLIPKVEWSRSMKEFRHISLCNVSYKIISKVLCQRLERLLPEVISETQSSFVAGRAISNNILVAQEAFHSLNTKYKCKKNFMAIKTDVGAGFHPNEINIKLLSIENGQAKQAQLITTEPNKS